MMLVAKLLVKGKRDVKCFIYDIPGEKLKIQKRHMIMTIKEANENFNRIHSDVNIKKSKYYV